MLLNNYCGLSNCMTKMSKIDNITIWWEYRKDNGYYQPVCNRDDADYISLENDRSGKILLMVSLINHPALDCINADERLIVSDLI